MKTTLELKFILSNDIHSELSTGTIAINTDKNIGDISIGIDHALYKYLKSIESIDYKVVCVKKSDESFTLGKVYKVKNGTITGDNGIDYCGIKSLEDLNDKLFAQFIEYKGEA
nr:MAG TPA: hypothetical protein [Caudoviricetes sp.]